MSTLLELALTNHGTFDPKIPSDLSDAEAYIAWEKKMDHRGSMHFFGAIKSLGFAVAEIGAMIPTSGYARLAFGIVAGVSVLGMIGHFVHVQLDLNKTKRVRKAHITAFMNKPLFSK